MTDLITLDKTYIANTYARFPVELVSGHGSILTDAAGKDYIDMGSGIAVNAFGIADPEWKRAVTAQLDLVQHTSNLYYTAPCVRLAQMLCERTGMKKVFFGNSGAEANECAVKVARKWAAEHKGPEYSTILTLWNSFHGRTLTTLAATGQEHYHELFQPLTPGFAHIRPNDLADAAAQIAANKCAAVMIECIQGEGGVNVMEPEFVQGLAALAKENDILLIVDEVQTGNGRTGKLYSYMHYGVAPDLVSTAKGLGGGLPLGCCLMGERVAEVLQPGDHGSTFGGNPVCCAGAVSVLRRIDDALLAEVRAKGDWLRAQFDGAPGIGQVSGMGLMLGIKPKEKPAAEVVRACMDKGVLLLTAKDRVRLLPALNIPQALLEQAAAVIKAACAP